MSMPINSLTRSSDISFVGPYTSSKHALEGFTDALRRELMIHDLDVVLVQPGPIRTPIWKKTPDIDNNPFLGTEFEKPLRKFTKGYMAIGQKGFPPKIIGDKVVEIMSTNHPRTRYVITPNKIKNYLMPGFLPDRIVDRMIGKMLGLIKK